MSTPVVVAWAASGLRDVLANTSGALILVLIIVGVSVAGDRVAGVSAALSAALSFDFFLTVPYYRLAILDRADVQTALLLLAIGVGVNEIAQWGRRQHEDASRRAGYLAGVGYAARRATDGVTQAEMIETVCRMIEVVLDLDRCRFVPETAASCPSGEKPVLRSDGTVSWGTSEVDIARVGLPTMDEIELRAGSGGCFLLTSSTQVRRPGREALLVAVTLADQVRADSVAPAHGEVPP